MKIARLKKKKLKNYIKLNFVRAIKILAKLVKFYRGYFICKISFSTFTRYNHFNVNLFKLFFSTVHRIIN